VKKFCLALILTLCALTMFSAEWVPVKSRVPQKPSLSVVSSGAEETVVTVTIPGYFREEEKIGGESYAYFTVPGCANLMEKSAPSLPFLAFDAAISPAGEVSVSCEITEFASASAEKGHGWVMAVRKAVKDRAEGSGLAKAVGVGLPAVSDRAKTIATAIEAVLTAAKEHPAELRACGVLDKDLAKGQAILESLSGARSTQDDGMGKKKDLTALKNAVQIRVEESVSNIGTAGNLEFQDTNAALAQRFLDLIPPNGGDDGPPPEPPKA